MLAGLARTNRAIDGFTRTFGWPYCVFEAEGRQIAKTAGKMSFAYRFLAPNHDLNTHVRLVKEWQSQDVVAFSQLVDFTEIVSVRRRREVDGSLKPSYTAFVLDAIAKSLREHPKMNRIVYRGVAGYRRTHFVAPSGAGGQRGLRSRKTGKPDTGRLRIIPVADTTANSARLVQTSKCQLLQSHSTMCRPPES